MKLRDLREGKELTPEQLEWMKKYVYIITGSSGFKTTDGLIDGWKRDQEFEIEETDIRIETEYGGNVEMQLPIKLKLVRDIEIIGFKLNDYTNLPIPRTQLIIAHCEMGGDIMGYLSRCIANSGIYTIITHSKMRMDDVMEALGMAETHFKYYIEIPGGYLELKKADKFKLNYNMPELRIAEEYDSVFELQEKLMSIDGIEQMFL